METVILGIDLDNTIVCYEGVFHRAAFERGLVPADLPREKEEVRARLVAEGKEGAWTELQGLVYGALMGEARPFRGVLPFFAAARRAGADLKIISHRTRYPYAGERRDLHAAALGWLRAEGFLDPRRGGLARDDVFFEESAESKVRRIGSEGCTHFIDDLPRLLIHDEFPAGTSGMLFDPAGRHAPPAGGREFCAFRSWDDISRHFGIPAGEN